MVRVPRRRWTRLLEVDRYAADAAFASLAAHAVPGLERVDPDCARYERLVPAPSGPVPIAVTFDADLVVVDAAVTSDADVAALRPTVAHWLDLGTDIRAVETALARDPVLRPLVRARPGLRIIGSLDGFADAVMTVIGQQVSLAAGRTFGGRLVGRWGSLDPSSGLRLFPSPDTLASADPDELRASVGLTRARTRTVVELSKACSDGLRLDPAGDLEATRRRLLALPGIGPWTVDYLSLRVLRDPDALPSGDLVLQRALGVRSPREVSARAAPWSPWRAYAVAHLWHATAYGRPQAGG